MFVELAINAFEVGAFALHHQAAIRKQMKTLHAWLKRGTLRIAVFGPGGTGKSTLGQFVVGKLPVGGSGIYKESATLETCKIGGLACQLLVVPGQHWRMEEYSSQVRDVQSGKAIGILNVVSYGYHTFDLELAQHHLYSPGLSTEDFMKIYLPNRREWELDRLKLLVNGLMTAKGDLWMLTVVLKQDLWWDERYQVKKHYEEGPYEEALKPLRSRFGTDGFKHEYISLAPIIMNLRSKDLRLLAKNVAGYDQPIQYANSSALMDMILSKARK